jgi:hypothetical protein
MADIEITGPMIGGDAKETSSDFSLERLRLFIAGVAHLLPPAVFVWTLTITSSISSSYYTKARDIFVGSLFVIGTLFLAYEGHSREEGDEKTKADDQKPPDRTAKWIQHIGHALHNIPERIVSRIGGGAAILAALCPTACDFCETNPRSILHYAAAILLFSAIVYFCLIAFPDRVQEKIRNEERRKAELKKNGSMEALDAIQTLEEIQAKQRRRIKFYVGCGRVIAGVMLALLVGQFTLTEEIRVNFRLTYVAETAAMELFGFAWLIATKTIPFFAHETERYHPMGEKAQKQEPQPALGSA